MSTISILGKRKRSQEETAPTNDKPKKFARTDEEKAKIRESINKYYTTVPKDKHQKIMAKATGKKVAQYIGLTQFVREYESISEAARVTGIAKANIQHVVSGRNARAGGYHWKFV
jgi:hypothetical protein